MARLLYQQDSTPLHKRMARRHIRLCGQVQGATSYGQAMLVKLDMLKQKERERIEAEELCENALDDLVLKDAVLDNQVRTLFEDARRNDRDNMTQFSVVLFPNLTFSDIINMPMSDEPLKVTQLIEKLESFEESHVLRKNIEPLTQCIGEVNAALDTRRQAVETLRKRQANEELARNEVRAQYESNYLDARKNFGKQKAELLFPKVANKQAKTVKDPEESDPEE